MNYEHEESSMEKYILKMMLENENFLRTYATRLSPDIFSKDYRKISGCILHFFKEKKQNPNRKILEDIYIPKVIEEKEEKEKTLNVLKELYSLETTTKEISVILKTEIQSFIQERHILNKIVSAYSELTNNKNKDKCLSVMKEAFSLQVDESLGLDYFEDLENRAERISQAEDPLIDTGMKTLNELLGGGYRKKAFYVFAGPANSGKSLVLNDAAVNLALRKKHVLYICLELSEDYVAQRTDAKFGEIEMNFLNANPVDGIKKAAAKLKVLRDQGKEVGTLWYKEWAPNAAKYTDIIALMKNVETKKGIKFDFVIIDYLKLLSATGKVYGDSMYSKLTTVCEEVRRLAIEENVCVLSASQTNRESYGSNAPGMENLSDSIGIAQTADCIVTIGIDASLQKEGMAILSIAKSRFSKRGTNFYVKLDCDYMRLTDVTDGSKFDKHMKQHSASNSIKSEVKKEQKPKAENDFNIDI